MAFKGWEVNGEEVTRLAEGNPVAAVGEPRGSISIYAAAFWECSRMKQGLEAPSTLWENGTGVEGSGRETEGLKTLDYKLTSNLEKH